MMKCQIFDRTYELHLTYEDDLSSYYEVYRTNEDILVDTTVLSTFSHSIVSKIPFDQNGNISVQTGTTSTKEQVIVNYNEKRVIHQMTFDPTFKRIQMESAPFNFDKQNAELEHFKVGLAFACSIMDDSGIVMHGSAISYKNQGVIFSADSGVGKSTQSNLWKKYKGLDVAIVNDDKPALKILESGVSVYGTPFSGKHHINDNTSVPLSAIVFLKQGEMNRIKQLNTKEAIPALLNNTTRLDYASPQMGKYMTLIQSLVMQIPIYQLECTISEEAVDVAYEAIFGGKYEN